MQFEFQVALLGVTVIIMPLVGESDSILQLNMHLNQATMAEI